MNKEYLVSAKEMKQLDYNTITKTGLPSLVLMERAALCVAQSVMEHVAFKKDKQILVVAGNGNNGADGVCAARILKEFGYPVSVCVIAGNREFTKELALQLDVASKYNVPIMSVDETEYHKYPVIVDAIFGIGLNRSIEGKAREVIERINKEDHYVVSVDIPSGVNASDGSICGVAIKANETVSFGFYKRGQLFFPGRSYCGIVNKVRIAIDSTGFYGMEPEMVTYMADSEEEKIDFTRSCMGNKGTFGKVLVIAGRSSTAGAAVLCVKSAFRSGCGMCAVFTQEENRDVLLSAVSEAMLETYSSTDSEEVISGKMDKWLDWSDVVVIGCGLGKDKIAYSLLEKVINDYSKPIVFDADALRLIAEREELKNSLYYINNKTKRAAVFTPHPGEMAALLNCSVDEIKNNRIAMGKKVCEEYGVILAAKDADTLCLSKNESMYLNSSGNDGLATAGSGDVLAGLTGSFIAQALQIDMSVYEAVCRAVFLHGHAADYLKNKIGKRFMVASDIIEAYKYILK